MIINYNFDLSFHFRFLKHPLPQVRKNFYIILIGYHKTDCYPLSSLSYLDTIFVNFHFTSHHYNFPTTHS